MIFNVPEHIDMIRNGLDKGDALARIDPNLYQTMPLTIIKTQTRRLNRGIYKVGKDYAVQRKRGIKAEQDIRIVMDRIWKETGKAHFVSSSGRKYVNANEIYISKEDAIAEGSYTSLEYELEFKKAYPKWAGFSRWVYEFHVIEVRRE